MHLLISVSLLILWSSIISLKANGEDVVPDSSIAIATNAFTVIKGPKIIDKSSIIETGNMPAVQSQDTVGSCFGCAPATIVQKFICDSDPFFKNNQIKCANSPRNKVVSQLSLVAWADTNIKQIKDNPNNQQPGRALNHTNITLYEDRGTYSSGSNALMNSVKIFKFMPDSCYPFDQFVEKYGNKDSSLFKTLYDRTKAFYHATKSSTEASTSNCGEECLAKIQEDFGPSISQENLTLALRKDTYGEFLYTLLFKNCEALNTPSRPTFKQLPEKNQTLEKTLVLESIKNVLKKDKPILLTGLCLEPDSSKNKCLAKHSTVISGYRKVCPDNNFNNKNCKTELKIHNCWGEDWQKQTDGGWVDSESLIKHINFGQNNISEGTLSWLE